MNTNTEARAAKLAVAYWLKQKYDPMNVDDFVRDAYEAGYRQAIADAVGLCEFNRDSMKGHGLSAEAGQAGYLASVIRILPDQDTDDVTK